MTKRIVILTGSETRHIFFRKTIALDERINVLASFCEGKEKSLETRVKNNKSSSKLEMEHVLARNQSEKDFFEFHVNYVRDDSSPVFIKKGDINKHSIVRKIIDLDPDLLICYGSSLIKSELINVFNNKFLNVHLGLSPYYRGSGTNIWPLIKNEPEMIGATFMHLDSGIDTGKIIHQIRAEIYLGDSPHTIGNRLIKEMTNVYKKIILNFDNLKEMNQPNEINGKLYLSKDFNDVACRKLYDNFGKGIVEKFLQKENKFINILENPGIKS
tara:strand:+ start:2995 stop:3807 length:813 start_codon:yes stop_codon:yes gene_type:complete